MTKDNFGPGLKYDEAKLRWDLLDLDLVEEVVKILTFGANKYGPNNWQKVEDAEERYYAALMRHLTEYRKGNSIDEESGLSHLSHLLCNAIFLLWFEKNLVKKTDN
jgi:hypothetical protein